MEDKISIVMGIYNCEKYLKDSIESIISQTYTNWELIMCDDGSKDNTYKIAKEYENRYNNIKVLKNEKNMGLNYTLNKCIEEATGDYIARQDGDDISLPDRLEKEIKKIKESKHIAVVSCNAIYFDNEGEWGQSHLVKNVSKNDFLKGSPTCHAAALIRRDALNEVGKYTVSNKLLRVEDYHLWFKIYSKGYKIINLQENLYKIRDDKDAYNRRNFKNRKNEMYVKYIGFKMIKMPLIYYIYILRPLAVGILPQGLYNILHKGRLKKEKN